MKSNKLNHCIELRFYLNYFSMLNGCVSYFKKKLFFFLVLSTFITNAQFFVDNETDIYIDSKATIYINCKDVYLFSKIDNNGLLLLDNTRNLIVNDINNSRGITFINDNNLNIKTQNSYNIQTFKKNLEVVKKVQKTINTNSSTSIVLNNVPFDKSDTFLKENILLIATSPSPHIIKKNLLMFLNFQYNFEQLYSYKKNNKINDKYSNLLFNIIEIVEYSNPRPPPFVS